MDDSTFHDRFRTDLLALQEIAVSEGSKPDAPVPSCPGWTVADLFGHMWSNHRWVRAVLRTRDRAEVPEPGTHPIADFVDSVPDHLIAIRSIHPDEPCWNFGPPPRTAGFWIRRQAHEHAIHHWDVANALNLYDVKFDADFAADGVAEVVDMFYPRQIRLGRSGAVAAAVRLIATDVPGEWTLGDGEPAVTVRAPAATLYLGIWKRIALLDAPDAQLDGDRAALKDALALAITP